MTSEFKAHYAALARIAARLEDGDADIDEVLPLLEEAKAAYAACQERLEAVRRALGDVADDGGLHEDAGLHEGVGGAEDESDGWDDADAEE